MKVVAIADLHVGSRVALALDTHTAPGSIIRRKLYAKYLESTRGEWKRPDVLIVNGDSVDGQNRKSCGSGTWTTEIDEQCDEACELIAMWGAKQVFIVRGSGYHVEVGNTGLQAEEYIGRQLGAQQYPDSKDRSGYHWYITVDGVTFHVSHHIGVSSVFHYKSTPTAKEMLYAKLNDMLRHEMGKLKTNIVLRAHAHYFNAVEYSNSLGMVLPCWKALDDFGMKRGAISLSPDIGFIGFDIKDGRYRWEKNLFRLTEFQPAPHVIIKAGAK